ncbi:MAG: SlyX family protein [Endozoicomonadaceae bacterium]|nr:SlyX family protein [Endozoicomonadaceae bacterium]
MNDELLEVQTQLSFQENSLQALNDVVTRQQKDIECLTLEVARLHEQLLGLASTPLEEVGQLPPHY